MLHSDSRSLKLKIEDARRISREHNYKAGCGYVKIEMDARADIFMKLEDSLPFSIYGAELAFDFIKSLASTIGHVISQTLTRPYRATPGSLYVSLRCSSILA